MQILLPSYLLRTVGTDGKIKKNRAPDEDVVDLACLPFVVVSQVGFISSKFKNLPLKKCFVENWPPIGILQNFL